MMLQLWEFSPTAGGDEDGFSDAYIETFTGDTEKYLAREAIQNSLDAKIKGSDDPVIVTFDKIELKRDLFPGVDDIRVIFERCLDYWPKDKKVNKFFSESLNIIEKPTITFLKISDYNTTGVRGSDNDKEKEWFNLVKAQGASSKKDGTGGSFGIGKGAPFAASNFRIVFYSTLNENNEYIFQGKARLVSHIKENEVRRGIGAYGYSKQTSIREKDQIPDQFRRSKQGTDIYISAYQGDDKWKDNLIISVLENFWAAIEKNVLIVKIGEKEINSRSLLEDLIHFCGTENPNSTYYYYQSYLNPSKKYTGNLNTLGNCELYISLIENAGKKIAAMRMPRMLVKLFDFRSPKPFLGVFIAVDEKGNNILREMEPPSHNDWEAGRVEGGKKILDEIKDWIRKCLNEITRPDESEIAAIEGMERYFQLPEDEDFEGKYEALQAGQYSDEVTASETSKETSPPYEAVNAKVNERHKEPVINSFTTGSLGGENPKPGKKNTSKKGKNRGGAAQSEEGLDIFADVECKTRSILKQMSDGTADYIIILKPEQDFKGNVKVKITGEDQEYPAELISCIDDNNQNYSCINSYIKDVKLKCNEIKKFTITIKAKHKYAITLE